MTDLADTLAHLRQRRACLTDDIAQARTALGREALDAGTGTGLDTLDRLKAEAVTVDAAITEAEARIAALDAQRRQDRADAEARRRAEQTAQAAGRRLTSAAAIDHLLNELAAFRDYDQAGRDLVMLGHTTWPLLALRTRVEGAVAAAGLTDRLGMSLVPPHLRSTLHDSDQRMFNRLVGEAA